MYIDISEKAQEMIKGQLKDQNKEEVFLRILIKSFG